MQSKYRVLDTTYVDYARAVECSSTLMNTYHKWLSGRSRKERCFKEDVCFETEDVSHACNINLKMETSTFLQSNLTLGDKEILKIENNRKIARPIGYFSSICTITQLSTPALTL